MQRGDKVILAAFGLALGALLVGVFAGSWPAFWHAIFGQTMAAWVQAAGVFIAVAMSGALAARQASKAKAEDMWERLASASAVLRAASDAAYNLEHNMLMVDAGEAGDADLVQLKTIQVILEGIDVLALPGYWEITSVIQARVHFSQLCIAVENTLPALAIQEANKGVYKFNFGGLAKQAAVCQQLADHAEKRLAAKAKALTGRAWD